MAVAPQPSSNWAALKKTLPPSHRGKKRKRDSDVSAPASSSSQSAPHQPAKAPAVDGRKSSTDPGRYVALDCEFVGVGLAGTESMLARVSIVNFHGHTLLDTFVKPKERVTDYRTWVSGIHESDLNGQGSGPLESFEIVQKQVAGLLDGRILVGHALANDLKCLMLSHPRAQTRDTSTYGPLQELAQTKRPALRKLAKLVLDLDIQADLSGGHSSVEDAKATMDIYRKYKSEWEASLRAAGNAPPGKQAAAKTKRDAPVSKEGYKQSRSMGLSATLRHVNDDDPLPARPPSAQGAGRGPAAKKARTKTEWWKEM